MAGSRLSSVATRSFWSCVASSVQRNVTMCLIMARRYQTQALSTPDEQPYRVRQHRADVAEHGGAELPVHDAMVEGQRKGAGRAHRELSVHDPWHLPDLAERQYGRLARGEDRGAAVHPEHPDVGDRDRAA